MVIKISKAFGLLILIVVVSLLAINYFNCEIFNFQPAKKFSGNYLYNPYKNCNGAWMKANFHEHSVAWGGLTNGKQQPQDIFNAYTRLGYDYSAISNYENVSGEDFRKKSIASYEHGYNISKTHQIVLAPHSVCFHDFPLFQFASSKQYIINELSKNSNAVILAHPQLRNGYSDDDLKKLTGYNLMEVLNHAVISTSKWDDALSAGKPVWIVGDDDTHNIYDPYQTFRNWTMVNCTENNCRCLTQNLLLGRAFAVNGFDAINQNKLSSVTTKGMNVDITFDAQADSIKLIGQNGAVKKVEKNTNSIVYTFSPRDTYIRAEAFTKKTSIYLNPVIRFNGGYPPQNNLTATENTPETILLKTLVICFWITIILAIFKTRLNRLLVLLKRKTTQAGQTPSVSI